MKCIYGQGDLKSQNLASLTKLALLFSALLNKTTPFQLEVEMLGVARKNIEPGPS